MSLNVERILSQQTGGLPRYTSYPPANHFQPGGGAALQDAMIRAAANAADVSLYLHLPFCDRLCWFCGCHTKQTLRYEPVAAYVDTLCAEIALWGQKLGTRPKVAALHLGGGSPSLLREAELTKLKSALDSAFDFSFAPEISIEIDPSDALRDGVDALAAFGMTRASIGVQDFDSVVQAAINRPQTFEQTADIIQALRRAGVRSINIDALYGLPLQDETRFRATVAKVISLAPDRVALFGYAHVPWLKTHQRMINTEDLPDAAARFRHAQAGADMLTQAGYQAIGIDHFAKPQDSLAQAARAGRLHRNFQGYTDDAAPVRIGFGASAIGCFPGGFVQNEVATGRYQALVGEGQLALSRGLALDAQDALYGHIIERLMCDFGFNYAALEARFGADALPAIALARKIAALDQDGLCESTETGFALRVEARPFVRIIAARFDQWLQRAAQQYSKVV